VWFFDLFPVSFCSASQHSHFGDLGEQSDKDECAERVIGMPDAAMFSGVGDFLKAGRKTGKRIHERISM
jgi:hypothetical protein